MFGGSLWPILANWPALREEIRAQDDDAKARLRKSAFYALAQAVANTKAELVVPDFYVTVPQRLSERSDEARLVFALVADDDVLQHISTLGHICPSPTSVAPPSRPHKSATS